MVLHDANEGLVVETAVGDPERKLGVPDQSVAVNLKLVLLGVCGIAISIVKGEVVARWFGRLPLHGVLRGKAVEVGLDDGVFLRRVPESQSSSHKLLSCSEHRLVEAIRRVIGWRKTTRMSTHDDYGQM